jgi:hypothetical protein
MPEALSITATHDTPEIILNPETGIFKISKRSYPEDAAGFYKPVIDWLSEFRQNPPQEITFVFNLEYYNTASAKQIFKVLQVLQETGKQSKVKILWQFFEDDSDMEIAGERFASLISNVAFEIVSIPQE